MSAISTIRNLGPATEAAFARAGVTTARELHALGPDAAYAKLLEVGERPHFIAYYALVMGLQGRPWNDCRGAEKDALRTRFDAICAAARPAPQSELERMLDMIGVVPKRDPM
ncbi:TfoX/Sxy family DNA transformation protein [Roseisalinus antarcticus]|uniref:TfoX C-terminal domain-containing protein n=1 Tax=Roseisalinus antarcticus TaxID=254357 RepID=A0A1Y5RIG8_9RHOB|nr:TfoX/Sxy family DNA transformation protein [Roseisalinus antarcticus]SLN18070.1 hypothetical protein ROA7023_00366 [Roseisalinus antarcticus]